MYTIVQIIIIIIIIFAGSASASLEYSETHKLAFASAGHHYAY